MESSTVLAFRIFVMLSCLIIVPMAAIFGSAFPDVVKTVLVDRVVALSTGKPMESKAATPDPHGFREVTPSIGAAPSDQPAQWEAPRWGAQGGDAAAWPPQGGPPSAPTVVPASGPGNQPGYNQSASFVVPVDAGQQPPASHPYQQPGSMPGVSQGQPGPMPASQPLAAADRTACPLEQPDRFTEMERRLREYGATYYLLETWGNSGELYRFHCRMAVANNGNYSRHFEATDRDGLKAMADVLTQVEAWRNGSTP